MATFMHACLDFYFIFKSELYAMLLKKQEFVYFENLLKNLLLTKEMHSHRKAIQIALLHSL